MLRRLSKPPLLLVIRPFHIRVGHEDLIEKVKKSQSTPREVRNAVQAAIRGGTVAREAPKNIHPADIALLRPVRGDLQGYCDEVFHEIRKACQKASEESGDVYPPGIFQQLKMNPQYYGKVSKLLRDSPIKPSPSDIQIIQESLNDNNLIMIDTSKWNVNYDEYTAPPTFLLMYSLKLDPNPCPFISGTTSKETTKHMPKNPSWRMMPLHVDFTSTVGTVVQFGSCSHKASCMIVVDPNSFYKACLEEMSRKELENILTICAQQENPVMSLNIISDGLVIDRDHMANNRDLKLARLLERVGRALAKSRIVYGSSNNSIHPLYMTGASHTGLVEHETPQHPDKKNHDIFCSITGIKRQEKDEEVADTPSHTRIAFLGNYDKPGCGWKLGRFSQQQSLPNPKDRTHDLRL